MSALRNVDEALQDILSQIKPLDTEMIPIINARGRALATDIIAPFDLPPFDNSSMDGFAVKAEDIATASQASPAILRVTMDIPAGSTPKQQLNTGEAARIMTGAPLPIGADTIVPVEQTNHDWSDVQETHIDKTVDIFHAVPSNAYIRPIGENFRKGQTLLQAGSQLRPQDIGLLASIGHAEVTVVRQPQVVILATGDELLTPDIPLTEGKIYDSNSPMLASLLQSYGVQATVLPIAPDTLQEIRALFQRALTLKPDLIISSAGVSVGAADYVKTVIEELGSISFWRVNLRPGKPFAFGSIKDIPYFGLPGNPVSAMITAEVFLRPVVNHMLGLNQTPASIQAILDEDLESDGRRSYIRVTLTKRDGITHATTTGTQSSGALYSLVIADGLLIIPEGQTFVSKGTQCTVQYLS